MKATYKDRINHQVYNLANYLTGILFVVVPVVVIFAVINFIINNL